MPVFALGTRSGCLPCGERLLMIYVIYLKSSE